MSITPTDISTLESAQIDSPGFWDQPVTICGKTDTLAVWTEEFIIDRNVVYDRVAILHQTPVEALTHPDFGGNCVNPEDVISNQVRRHFARQLDSDPRSLELLEIERQLSQDNLPDLVDFSAIATNTNDLRTHCQEVAEIMTDEHLRYCKPSVEEQPLVATFYQLVASLAADHVSDCPELSPDLARIVFEGSFKTIQSFVLDKFIEALGNYSPNQPEPIPQSVAV